MKQNDSLTNPPFSPMSNNAFSYFKSIRGRVLGTQISYDEFIRVIESPQVAMLAGLVAEGYKEKKLQLPAMTWQAFFPDGHRKAANAVPSGLFMLDVDKMADDPAEVWHQRIEPRREELGICVAHITPSRQGLRLVAYCRCDVGNIEQHQQWLSAELGLDYDPVCKDMARTSFLVPKDYFLYLNPDIFTPAPQAVQVSLAAAEPQPAAEVAAAEACAESAPMQTEYDGIPLINIAHEWLMTQGGEPQEGMRNTMLYKLALRMRYITEFRPEVVAANIPHCGLGKSEVLSLCQSACQAQKGANIPEDLTEVITCLKRVSTSADPADEPVTAAELCDTQVLPPMPPIFKQLVQSAPQDFKAATALCMLPMLGTVGSKLRAVYLDGNMHSPSFQVSLEAPQASGKNFMGRLADRCLAPVKELDAVERKREEAYMNELKLLRQTSSKLSKKDREQLGEEPTPLVRNLSPIISITKSLMRMNNAQGLHCFSFAPEIDTVYKAFGRGFSNLSDMLRCAFDNAEYGQDYASDTSFSGMVKLYYNTLFSGTPKAMRRFYPDVENGLVSRVLFITIPDQFGKELPVWGKLSESENQVLNEALARLNEVSIKDGIVQEDYVMDMGFLNARMQRWLKAQRELAVRTNDRTRDTFCRRAAVVGFRAGMLAWFLWGESAEKAVQYRVNKFAVWVANSMLLQHLLRFQLDADIPNTFLAKRAYDMLPRTFSREDVARQLHINGYHSDVRSVLSKWKIAGYVIADKSYGAMMYRKVA